MSTHRPQDAKCTCFQQNKTKCRTRTKMPPGGLTTCFELLLAFTVGPTFQHATKRCFLLPSEAEQCDSFRCKALNWRNLSQTSCPPNGILMGRSIFTNVFSCLQTMSIMNSYHLHNKHPFSDSPNLCCKQVLSNHQFCGCKPLLKSSASDWWNSKKPPIIKGSIKIYPPQKKKLRWQWKFTVFNRRYIFIHGCFPLLYHVRFKGFSLIIKSSEKLKDYLKVEWSAGFDSKALNQRMFFCVEKNLQIIVFGLAEQRFILDLIFFSESQVRFMIHSHKTQILWSTSYKWHYACRWSSWHYSFIISSRGFFFTWDWDGENSPILPFGRGESTYSKRILRGEEETTVICLTWPLRVGNKPTSWGFVAPFNLEKPRSCFSNDFQVKKGYMSPKVVRFGTSDMNFQEFHQKIPSRSFKR